MSVSKTLAVLVGVVTTGLLVLLLRYRLLGVGTMQYCVREWGYWAMWVLVVPGFVMAWRKRTWFASLPTYLSLNKVWFLLGGVFLVPLTLIHEPRLTKINYDEHTLLSISRSMHLEQKAAWVADAKLIGGTAVPIAFIVDKRPVFYPFVLSQLHKIFGYRLGNIYWLNGALCAVLLGITFLILRRLGGPIMGLAGAALIAGLPLLAQNATSGGFDLLNLVMLAALTWSAVRYLEQPQRGRLGLMVWFALLLANVRYESVLFLIIPVAVYLVAAWRTGRLPDVSKWLIAAPLGLLPVFFSNAVFMNQETFFQMPKDAFWTSKNYLPNLEHAVAYLFGFDAGGTNAWWLAMAGAVALPASLLVLRRKVAIKNGAAVYWIFGVLIAAVLLHATLILGLSWGRWDDPLVARFTLPLWWLLVCVICICVEHLRDGGFTRAPQALLVGAFFTTFVMGTGRAALASDTYALRMPMGIDWTLTTLEARDPWHRSLVLARSTLPYTNSGFCSMTVDKATTKRELLRAAVHHQLYGQIYVVVERQRSLNGGKWETDDDVEKLSKVAKLEPLDELVIDPFYKVSLLKIDGLVDEAGVLPWPEPNTKDKENQDNGYRRRVYELMP